MKDKELLENYLLVLKSTMEVYVHGTLESSNTDIRSTLNEGLDMTLNSQEDTYNRMCENNWYQVENIKCSDIKKEYDKLNCE